MRTPNSLTGTLLALALAAVHGPAAASTPSAVIKTYGDIAQAGYEDSVATARTLQAAVDRLLAAPGAESLRAARAAWVAARVPYQQTEVYRFGNVIVDEWEGKVNAWPLDEGLIDYVDASYGAESEENAFYAANVVANPKLKIAGKMIEAATIDANLLRSLHEVDEVEANVATGYHAVEFLLWGQDLNGTGPGAGNRPWSDFAAGSQCTGGNCDRRRAYLKAATDLLVSDLEEMAAAWRPGGPARDALKSNGLEAILTGMGSLSYGELAGERMRLGLMLHDPEEEHDCFADNTHSSHYFDALGIRNVYVGRYRRVSGEVVSGAGISDLVRGKSAEVDRELMARLDATMAAMTTLRDHAERGEMAYDQMLGEGNKAGNAIVQGAVDALVAQTRSIERAAAALGLTAIKIEGSDSLDNPSAVFK